MQEGREIAGLLADDDRAASPQASSDVREAYLWYEGQRQGLGEEFLRALKAAEDFIAAFRW